MAARGMPGSILCILQRTPVSKLEPMPKLGNTEFQMAQGGQRSEIKKMKFLGPTLNYNTFEGAKIPILFRFCSREGSLILRVLNCVVLR